MIIASIITSIISPFAKIFGWLLAAFYSISGSYGISIILLTLLTMIVVFPLTRKGTRSMMQMQLLQPELLKMRNKYKKKPGMSAEERRELTTKQQEEMMALYRENGVSPTGGCLPMFLQFPVFIVLYDTIRGLTTTATVGRGKAAHIISRPQYINPHTGLYKSLIHSGGKMDAFGLNLADSVRSHQAHWIDVIPYVVVILIAVGLQYVSIWQITNRNPQAGANQQMQQIQKFMPLIFVFIYIEFPAGVGLYFIVSSMFRIGQQEWMYKRDPHILESISKLKEMKLKNPPPVVASPKGWRQRLAALAPPSRYLPRASRELEVCIGEANSQAHSRIEATGAIGRSGVEARVWAEAGAGQQASGLQVKPCSAKARSKSTGKKEAKHAERQQPGSEPDGCGRR